MKNKKIEIQNHKWISKPSRQPNKQTHPWKKPFSEKGNKVCEEEKIL